MTIPSNIELGDTQAALLAADNAEVAKPWPVEPGERSQRLVPIGWQAVHTDGESLLDNPRRAKGTIKVRSAAGFVQAIRQRWPVFPVPGSVAEQLATTPLTDPGGDVIPVLLDGGPPPVALYADEASNTLVCILNDDQGLTAGWRDHRILLDVKYTDEWVLWTKGQGLKAQEEFADLIDHGAKEIVEPSAADMLHIAEKFEATIGIELKKGERVRDGRQQFVYTESIEANATDRSGGSIEIPEQFVIQVKPFIGGKPWEVIARIRYRIRNKQFHIGYELERVADIERMAFRQLADEVATAFSLPVIEGEAPGSRS